MIFRQLTTQLALTALLFLFGQAARAQSSFPHHWIRTNPGGGGAFSAAGATPGGILFVGSDLSGLYRSTDRGRSWQPLGARQGLLATHISGLGFDHHDGNVVFAGTDEGIYRSADAGSTFVHVLDHGYVTDIQMGVDDPILGYAAWHPEYDALGGAVYRTTDRGMTWLRVSQNLPHNLRIVKLVVDPNNARRLYLISGEGRFACGPAVAFFSMDSGATWQRVGADLGQLLDIAIDPRNPQVIYATTLNADCNAPDYWLDLDGALYRSTDGGHQWTLLTRRTGVIWVRRDAPDTLRLIDPREPYPWNPDAGTWQSTDAGDTWQHIGRIDRWDYGYQGAAYWAYGTCFDGIIHTLGEDLSEPNTLFWVTTQWVYGTFDGGVTFRNLFTEPVGRSGWRSRGIDNVNMLALAVSEADPERVYVGYFDIGFWRSDDGGRSWQSGNDAAFTGDWEGFGGNVASILADPARADVVWATFSGHQNGEYPTYLVRSDKGGQKGSWRLSNTGLPAVEVMGLSLDPTSAVDRRTLFVTANGDVYRSRDDGRTWEKVDDCNGCRFTAVDHFDGSLVYAGGEIGLRRSTDGGATWRNIGPPELRGDPDTGFWDYGWQGVFDIKTDPHRPGWVYVTEFGDGRGLYRSADRGESWQKLLTDDFMRGVAISPTNPDVLYATSSNALEAGGYDPRSRGVLVSMDGGATWAGANDGMTWPFAVPVTISADGWVWVGSPGTGVQKARIPGAPTALEPDRRLTDTVVLQPNFPNPFNPETTIRYRLSATGQVELAIYDLTGRRVRTLVAGLQAAGAHTVSWDGRDSQGRRMPSGVYFVRLIAGKQVQVRRMVLLL